MRRPVAAVCLALIAGAIASVVTGHEKAAGAFLICGGFIWLLG